MKLPYGDRITRLFDSYVHKVERAIRRMDTRMFERLWLNKPTVPDELPWEPLPGMRCPYCHGHGEDRGGPGSWTCGTCNGTGRLSRTWVAARPWVVLTEQQKRDKAWREVVDYYAQQARRYRGIMGWESPEVDFDAPRLPTGEYLDRPTDKRHPYYHSPEDIT